MDIQKVTVNFGITVNMGDYENMRMDVHIEAEMTTLELEDGGLNDLLEQARHELAYGLVDMADAKLREATWWGDDPDASNRRARMESPEYAWIHKLHPAVAKDILGEVLNDYWESKGVVALTPPPVNEPHPLTPSPNGEGETEGEDDLDAEPDYDPNDYPLDRLFSEDTNSDLDDPDDEF